MLSGTPVTVSSGNDTAVNFILDPIGVNGGRISGHIEGGGMALANTAVIFYNVDGNYVFEVRTNPNGDYETNLLTNETYYVRTHYEPLGFGHELYDGYPCTFNCDDPVFVTSGTPVVISGADEGNVDFNLQVPPGNIISGKITDDVTSAPMPDIYIVLFDENGNGLTDTFSDQHGDYYFSGLSTGNYKVYAQGVPEGYAGELYDGIYCPDWNCDFGTEGAPITIPGPDAGGDSGGHDIELTFTGRRIFGTITRSDSPEPVSSNYGWMGVDIFNSFGNYITTVGTNSAGQYQVTGMELATGDYLVHTTHDTNFHGLINEAWDDYPCAGECDPLSGDTVNLADDQTTIANFILDPAPSISGTVIADFDGASLANIEVCVTRRDGYWQGCTLTDENGNYTVQGLPPEADLIPFINDTNGQPYLLETYIDQPQYDWGNGTGVDISSANATLIDFSLADGTVMSGTLLSEFDGPVTNGGASFFRTDGSWAGFDHVDENGQWAIALPDGDYFLFLEGWDAFNSYVDIFTNGITELSCMNQSCDWVNQAPVFTIAGSPQTFDATLALGNLVTGTLSVDDGVDITPVINEGSVTVYDSNGNWVDNAGVDENGNWSLHLGDGDYFFYIESWGTYEYFVSELHDGADGIPCAGYQCFAGDWVNQGPKLTVDGSWANPLDAELEMGVIFSGTLTDEISGDPINNLRLYFYDEDVYATGSLTEAFRQLVWADSNGNYRTPAMQIINYLPFSTGYDLGYGREFYDNQKCDPVDCDDAFANRTALFAGVDFEAGDDVTVSFNLIRRVTFSGVVTDGVNPLEGIAVDVWDTKGNHLETVETDASGNFFANFGGPNHAAAEYFITANGEDNGYIGQVYGDPANADCPRLYCVQGGAPGVMPISTLNGQDRNDINFSLNAQNPATISGSILDFNGQPYPGGIARLYYANGNHATDAWVDGNGNFETGLLPDGTYFAVTKHTYDVIDDRWDGINGSQCLNELCDVLAGTPIVISGGLNVSGIDFILDPINSGGRISGHAEDIGGIAIENMAIAIFNSNGDYLGETRTDSNGNYQTMPFADDTYYARTHNNEPGGLGRQLYNLFDCLPVSDCYDPAYIANNGAPIQITGTNYGGVDFVLSVPAGNVISGKVTDDGISAPLPDVYVVLFNELGNWVAEVVTDKFGDYYFSGLDDGDYKVYASGVPEGYSSELYNDIFCPDWSCDFGSEGQIVNVSGGDANNINIALNYSTGTGSRIFGTVTRSDSSQPVTSQYGYFEVQVFDTSGNHIGGSSTNSAGQYQLHFPGAGDYYLVTAQDVNFHGLINEGWDDFDGVQCYDNCNPIDIGATLIHVNDSETVVADFILEPAARISGTVTDEVDGAALEGVTICWTSKATENPWKGCTQTDSNGDYVIAGLEPLADYVVWTWELGGLPYHRETYDDLPCCDRPFIPGGTSIDVTSVDQVADIALARSSTISGNVTDSVTGLPIENLRMQVWTPQCEWLSEARTDADGNYTLSGFNTGSYHVNAWGTELGYIQELYPDRKVWHPCDPDIQYGLPTAVGEFDHVSGIDFALDFGASISGTIRDNFGATIENNFAQARLYDLDGKQLMVIRNREENGSYFLGGLQPGSYHVILSSRGLGLVDERFDDVTCPRNSCDSNLGVPVVVGPEELVSNIDATLSLGAVIQGKLTDKASGNPIQTCIAFYTTSGKYAGFACSDTNGDYESSSGFPDGDYLASNQFRIVDYEPVPLGYLPQVWVSDPTAFGACGEPCDFLQGDTFTVSGVTTITGINLAMEFGSTIEGTVTTDLEATPLAGIQLQMLNAVDASVIRTLFTDESGNYSFTGVGSGDYRLRTSNGIGYGDLLYDSLGDVSCNPFCDPLSGGVISVGSNTTDTIDFDLQPTPAIAGNVTDHTGTIASGTRVEAYDSLGTEIASATTDVDGNYTITSLWTGTFYLRTANIVGFVDVLYDGQACGGSCDPLNGTGVVLAASGTQSGIDLQMLDSVNINGRVTDGTDAISGVTIELYLDTGAFVSSTTTDGSGAYRLGGLTAGNYHLVSRNNFGFVDEGAGGGVCQSTCAPTSTAIVTVADVPVTRDDMVLDLGGEISGTVSDTDTAGLTGVTVSAFNDAGVQISTTVTGPDGNYLIRGLVGGNVYLRTSNAGQYRNQRYENLLCDAFCDVLSGLGVPVILGETVPGIDFNLESGFAISGTVRDSSPESIGIGFVLVEAFDATGLPSGSAFSVADGTYVIDGLVAGDYRLRTTNNAGFVDEVLGGDACTPEPCVIASGTATNISDADVTGVDIQLATGNPISGVATDTDGNPLPTGSALLYSTTGNSLKSAAINSGLFNFTGIADGTYYMLIKNDLGLVDQLYSGKDCPNGSCDVTLGTAIVLGPPPEAQQAYSTQSSSGDTGFKTQANHQGNNHLQVALPRGTVISGSIRTESNVAVQLTGVYILDADGKVSGEAITNGLGEFETSSGLPDGIWYAATQHAGVEGVGDGLINEVYQDIICTGDCVLDSEKATPLEVLNGSVDQTVDFILGTGGEISGTVSSQSDATPLAQVTIDLYDEFGDAVAQVTTNGQGEYAFGGLVSGDYRLLATPNVGAYAPVLFDGIDCTNGCLITDGSPVLLSSAINQVAGINFALPSTVSERNTDIDPTAQIGVGVEISQGSTVGAYAVIGANTVVNRNVSIGARCRIGERVLIEQGAEIGAYCEIGNDSLIGRDSAIEENVYIGSNTIIGKGSKIGSDVFIGNNVELGPGVKVTSGSCIPDDFGKIKKKSTIDGDLCTQ